MINHILLEVFCRKEFEEFSTEPYPVFCHTKGQCPTIDCLFRKCKYIDFTSCEDTLCYIGGESHEVYGISYGGDMEEGSSNIGVDEWQEIAISKVKEAYLQFMERKASSVPKME